MGLSNNKTNDPIPSVISNYTSKPPGTGLVFTGSSVLSLNLPVVVRSHLTTIKILSLFPLWCSLIRSWKS